MLVLAMEFSRVAHARRRRSLSTEQEQPAFPQEGPPFRDPPSLSSRSSTGDGVRGKPSSQRSTGNHDASWRLSPPEGRT